MIPTNQILEGDVLARLRELPDGCVQTVVTSPPYWGLRDYGVAGQIGLEATPEEFVQKIVEVFREVRRVLRDDGTLWMNFGDSYAGSGRGVEKEGEASDGRRNHGLHPSAVDSNVIGTHWVPPPPGLKTKDLVGVPWRVALALQSDGWWLRSDIIWSKPNPMPESVLDRPTKSHEYIFLMAKSETYFYDCEAVREKALVGNHHRNVLDCRKDGDAIPPGSRGHKGLWKTAHAEAGRNKRTVWEIPTAPFPGAHFATFPTKLVEPCILAGTSEAGACFTCGAPYARIIDVSYENPGNRQTNGDRSKDRKHEDYGSAGYDQRLERRSKTIGWKSTCDCGTTQHKPCVVLDPFMGSGTTALVAIRARRDFIGIELNPEYAAMARRRLEPELSQGRLM